MLETGVMARYPSGILYIIGNEAAERFSYYGMKAILVVFMTSYLRSRNGELATISPVAATAWYHLFGTLNYLTPLFGALVADIFWGKYKTIMRLSIVYCAGHLCLALDDTRIGLSAGLTLIAIGAGGIKPCVASHVGDQFSNRNADLLPRAFDYFYLAINIGAAISSFLTPYLLEHYGPNIAFGVPGLLMLIATIVFRIGKSHFIAVPPVGWRKFRQVISSTEGRAALKGYSLIYLFISFFWALLDQTGSSWVLQAERMQRRIDLSFGFGSAERWSFELLGSQIQAVNPLLIMFLVPFFSWIAYPALARLMNFGAVRRIGVGLILAGLSFGVVGLSEIWIQGGEKVSILWQVLAYLILTMGEVMVSVTSLSFAYTQAPSELKSLLGSFYLFSVALGNALTAVVNFAILLPDGTSRISNAQYFFFFMGFILFAALLLFTFFRHYQEKSFLRAD